MDSTGTWQPELETCQGKPWERVESELWTNVHGLRKKRSVRNKGTCLAPLNVLPKTLSVLLGEEMVVGGESGREG